MSGSAMARAVEWSEVDWESLRAGRRSELAVLAVLRSAVDEVAGSPGGTLAFRERVRVREERAAAAWVRAIGARSVPAVAAAAGELAGLGEGSTPAGDDYLVGAMYALQWRLPRPRATSLCGAIAAAAAPRTSSLSATWLQRAAGGQAIPAWRFFLSALSSGEVSLIHQCARAVLALGHTSGRAALAGFIATTEVLMGDPA